MKYLILAATAVFSIGLVGCGAQTTSESPDTGFLDSLAPSAVVKGRLLQVDSVGTHQQPVAGSVILTGPNGAKVSHEVGPAGTFEIRVAPGRYQVAGTAPQPDGGTAQCAAKAASTTVTEAAPTRVDVFCVVQ